MAPEHPVARVRVVVAEGERVTVVAHGLTEVLLEDRIVVVTDHQLGQALSERGELGERGADLVTAQGVQRGQRSGVEGGDDEVLAVVDVAQSRTENAFVCGFRDPVVQGFLESEHADRLQVERARAIEECESETVALGGVGEHEVADLRRQRGDVALLQTEDVGIVLAHQSHELTRGSMLLEVVRDDLHDRSTLLRPAVHLLRVAHRDSSAVLRRMPLLEARVSRGLDARASGSLATTAARRRGTRPR